MTIRFLQTSLLACVMQAAFWGCLDSGGTEVPNEVTGILYTAAGTPAANAQVRLYPKDYAPSDANVGQEGFTAQTDAAGRYRVGKMPAGEYNLVASGQNALAFRDAIVLKSGRTRELAPDTLRAPGTVTATVKLQPQHSPQTALVQVLGTQYYVNVPADGRITLVLPRGTHRLRTSTILPNYVPLFTEVTVVAGRNDTLAEPLEPFYSTTSVVTGLTASANSSGVIMLTWKPAKQGNFQSYLIYRDSAAAILPSSTPYASTTDTAFFDTLYSKTPREGQYSHLDTEVHAFKYRVRILDLSDNIGPVFGSALGTPVPIARSYASGRWHRATANAPFGQRLNPAVVQFNNALWLFGGGAGSVWTSADGAQWQKATDALPVPAGYTRIRATVKGGKIWVLAGPESGGPAAIKVLNSDNGINWNVVKDSLPRIGELRAILTFRDTLWAVTNTDRALFQWSVDGVIWTSVPSSPYTEESEPAKGSNLAVFAGEIWVVGGSYAGSRSSLVVSSPNAKDWSYTSLVSNEKPQQGFLWRSSHSLAVHENKLWSIGGWIGFLVGDGRYPGVLTSQIWSSSDGLTWDIVDAKPFTPREQPATVSFQDRLWVIGGIQADGTNDIWYYE